MTSNKEMDERFQVGDVYAPYRRLASNSVNIASEMGAKRDIKVRNNQLTGFAQLLLNATPAELLYIRQALDGVLPVQAAIEKVRK